MIPGFQAASSLILNSVATGAANAFLTLRVGIISKQYCSALIKPQRRVLRRSAVVAAGRMLGGVASESTKRITGAFWSASKSKVGDVVGGVGDAVSEVGDRVKDSGSWLTGKVRGVLKKEEDLEEA